MERKGETSRRRLRTAASRCSAPVAAYGVIVGLIVPADREEADRGEERASSSGAS
jgi:hypothetical protein